MTVGGGAVFGVDWELGEERTGARHGAVGGGGGWRGVLVLPSSCEGLPRWSSECCDCKGEQEEAGEG